MEAYKEEVTLDKKAYVLYDKVRSWASTFLGVIITVIGVGVIFVISSLEGTKEIKASNSVSAEIISVWREENVGMTFPEPRVEIILFDEKEYYFIMPEDGEWYFAYEGGLGYVFSDYKFYVLTALTIVVAMYVANINYVSTVKSIRNTDMFSRTLAHYQKTKERVEKHTQYIPDFCIYKNKQAYDMAKRDIVEQADIPYEYYMSKDFDASKLSKWQIKVLKKIKKIKVKKIHSSDLLQEHTHVGVKVTLLPMSQKEHQRMFTISGFFQKVVSSALSGMVVAFGIVLGNWVLGITYGMVIVSSFISSIIVAGDFVSNTLRNRYIAKADYLNEFDNIKDRFIVKEEEKIGVVDTTTETNPEVTQIFQLDLGTITTT